MAFSELDLKRIDAIVGGLCRRHSPPQHRDKIRLEYDVKGHNVTLIEARPDWRDATAPWSRHPVAKLTYVRTTSEWRLYWMRASLRWNGYEPLATSRDLSELVAEIERDPYGCFFG